MGNILMDLTIVSATQHNSSWFCSTPLGQSLKKINCKNKIFFENNRGLSEIYNEALSTINSGFILFVHDDVWIHDIFLEETLEEAFNNYDVIGVAGSRKVSLKQERIAWHICEREFWRGAVAHPIKNDAENRIAVNSFGPFGGEVLTIDGLFMAVNAEKIKLNNIKFDEKFKFDFYDMDFCLTCHKAGLKTGIAPIFIVHESHGEGILKDSYLETQKMFLERWKD
jgi:GT2 family glycosyltransferase